MDHALPEHVAYRGSPVPRLDRAVQQQDISLPRSSLHLPAPPEGARIENCVFLFIGADPETRWLQGSGVALDAHGFVRTGAPTSAHADGSMPAGLESSVPGVFAIGDVRSGSVKRLGAAIGEGGVVVTQIHQQLAVARAAPRAAPPGLCAAQPRG